MKGNESMNNIQKGIQQDCCLIFEAIRRLVDGTCCLQDEEKLCAWDLFGKLKMALNEHIDYEESQVLPKLSAQDRDRHHSEHLKLRELLERSRFALEDTRGDLFRRALTELGLSLRAHHERDSQVDSGPITTDRNLSLILGRAKSALL